MKPTQTTKEQLPAGGVFDVQKVRRIAQIMKDYGLSDLELQDGEVHVRLSRASDTIPVQLPVATVAQNVVAPTTVAAPVVAEVAPMEATHIKTIDSPIVGTFYSKPNPNSPVFVNVGDVISEGKTVCIIEAMKVMNQLPADISGKVVAVLVKDGDAVEFGQPLFKVDVRG